jgi:hypothetical protein
MQNVGVVNDHIYRCFRASDVSDNKALPHEREEQWNFGLLSAAAR